jgi:hypothetical protein
MSDLYVEVDDVDSLHAEFVRPHGYILAFGTLLE